MAKISFGDRNDVLARLKLILGRMMKISNEKNPDNLAQWSWETDIFSDIGVDSVDTIDLMYAIEEEFGVKAKKGDTKLRRKLSEIVDYIIESSSEKKIK